MRNARQKISRRESFARSKMQICKIKMQPFIFEWKRVRVTYSRDLKRGGPKKERKDYQMLKRYDVLQIYNKKINLPSCIKEFFSKTQFMKRRSFQCDTCMIVLQSFNADKIQGQKKHNLSPVSVNQQIMRQPIYAISKSVYSTKSSISNN